MPIDEHREGQTWFSVSNNNAIEATRKCIFFIGHLSHANPGLYKKQNTDWLKNTVSLDDFMDFVGAFIR